MGRPQLDIGQHGSISFRVLGPKRVRAMAKVRDTDGKVRQVTREGTSRQDALGRLQRALRERPGFTDGDLTGESLVSDAARAWLAEVDRSTSDGTRAPNTARLYRLMWNNHCDSALGARRLGEVRTPTVDRFLLALRERHGAALVRTVRTVLNGVFGYALRHGAISKQPTQGVSRVRGGRRAAPRAMSAVERDRWVAALADDEVAVRLDLVALSRFMLATGCRIGEALAVSFEEIDRDEKTVAIEWTIYRVTGQGLVRGPTKTSAGQRTLRLPGWAMDLVVERGDQLGWSGPLFPAVASRKGGYQRRGGGWRDPSNTGHQLQAAAARAGFDLTSHVFRKTVATVLDESGLTAREIADQLGHAKVSITQDFYLGRGAVGEAAAVALTEMFGGDDS